LQWLFPAEHKLQNDKISTADQAPQQNNDRLQDNNDTSNKDNKPKTTSQRGPPTDKESLQSKDMSLFAEKWLLVIVVIVC
jgi:hypothetical protein